MEEYYVLISRNKSILKEPRNAEEGEKKKAKKNFEIGKGKYLKVIKSLN